MAHVALNHPWVDIGFKEMRCVAVPEGMDRYSTFIDASGISGFSKVRLNTCLGHDLIGCPGTFATMILSRKKKGWVAMGFPMLPEDSQCLHRQRNIFILCTLASMDVNHHSSAVDVRNVDVQAFREPKATGINGMQVGEVVRGIHVTQYIKNFFTTKNTG